MKNNPFWGNPFKKDTADMKTDIGFLSSVPIFDSLSKRQKMKLYTIIYVRNYEKDEVVFRQGDPGVGMYIVKEGSVEVFAEYDNLTCRKIATLYKGEFFGETSLLNESPRSATIISAEKSVLWGLFKPDLMNLMDSDSKLGLRLVLRLSQVVSERLRLVNIEFSRFEHGV